MFRPVVVPGDPVVVEEREQLVPVLQQPLAIPLGYLRAGGTPCDGVEETIDRSPVLAQVSPPQPVPVDGLDDPPEQTPELARERLQLLVPRVAPDVLVEVPDQMHEALLLRAAQRIVSGVE